MKTTTNLAKANIHNLISLWKAVSLPFNSYQNHPLFSYSEIPKSDWPNRVWLKPDMDIALNSTQQVRDIISARFPRLSLIYWDIFRSESWRQIEKSGFKKKMELTGMSLKLRKSFDNQNRIELKRVESPQEAVVWSNIFRQAFGYRIGKHVVEQPLNKADFFIAKVGERPAGTVITYHTREVTGIHGVGIVPEMRRKGIAEEMMKMILNESVNSGRKYATLQASEMGKGMYLKLGFEELFTMKIYHLNN